MTTIRMAGFSHQSDRKSGGLRTIEALDLLCRLLKSPSPKQELDDIALGRLEISMLSNHWHGLLIVRDHQELSRFVGHFKGNLSKELTRLLDWPGTVFPERFTAITISDEPEAQWARLKYVLRQSVKEGLVESLMDLKGLHAARPLVEGGYLEGHWYNRTEEFKARGRGEVFEKYDFATKYQIHFARLLAFRHFSEAEYRQKVTDLVEEIIAEEREARAGQSVKGMRAVQLGGRLMGLSFADHIARPLSQWLRGDHFRFRTLGWR